MKCPSCGGSISLFKLRESFPCPHCGVQLKANTSRLMLIMLCFGAVPWLLAEAAYFEFRSGFVTGVLLLLSYWAVLFVALRGTLEKSDDSPSKESAPPTP